MKRMTSRETFPGLQDFVSYFHLCRREVGKSMEAVADDAEFSDSMLRQKLLHPDKLTFRQLDEFCKSAGMDIDTAYQIMRGQKKLGVVKNG